MNASYYNPSAKVSAIMDKHYPSESSLKSGNHKQCSFDLLNHYLPTMDAETRARAEWTLRLLTQ